MAEDSESSTGAVVTDKRGAESVLGKEKRVFIPEISAKTFSGIMNKLKRLYEVPRVIHSKEIPWAGPENGFQVKGVIKPMDEYVHTFTVFMQRYPPNTRSQKHGHLNPAVFYMLKGKGFTIHDEKRFNWEAGDIVVIPPRGVVHQHFNPDVEKEAISLVFAPTVQFLMHLWARRTVEAGSGGSGTD